MYILKNILFICVILLSVQTLAEEYGGHKIEHGFFDAAEEYMEMAKQYKKDGKHDIAQDLERLAEIKINAGKLADQNRWDDISWDEYEKIDNRVNKKIAKLEESSLKEADY